MNIELAEALIVQANQEVREVRRALRTAKHVESWNYDTIMAQLAAASEKEGAAILKRIGINWS